MPETSRLQIALCVAGAVVVVLLGLRHLASGEAAPAASAPRAAAVRIEPERDERVLVHVAGSVRHPGVYRLPSSARVDDAVTRAGGATRRADLNGLNLAAEVEDGRQILVPERPPAAPHSGDAGGSTAAVAGAAATTPGQPVNLNTATLEQLDVLPGIGPAMAQRILDHREAVGGFGSVEELGDVPGIGDVRLASLREQVRV